MKNRRLIVKTIVVATVCGISIAVLAGQSWDKRIDNAGARFQSKSPSEIFSATL